MADEICRASLRMPGATDVWAQLHRPFDFPARTRRTSISSLPNHQCCLLASPRALTASPNRRRRRLASRARTEPHWPSLRLPRAALTPPLLCPIPAQPPLGHRAHADAFTPLSALSCRTALISLCSVPFSPQAPAESHPPRRRSVFAADAPPVDSPSTVGPSPIARAWSSLMMPQDRLGLILAKPEAPPTPTTTSSAARSTSPWTGRLEARLRRDRAS